MRQSRYIRGMRVDASSYCCYVECIRVGSWHGEPLRLRGKSAMVMDTCDVPPFSRLVNGADLVTPDGTSVVWMLRRLDGGKG